MTNAAQYPWSAVSIVLLAACAQQPIIWERPATDTHTQLEDLAWCKIKATAFSEDETERWKATYLCMRAAGYFASTAIAR